MRFTPAAVAVRATATLLGMVTICWAGAGCRDDAGRGSATVTTFDTIGSVIRVRNAGTPPVWSLVEHLTLGVTGLEAAESNEAFGRIRGVVADARGRIYVADANAARIRVFDATGAFVLAFGTEGSGPADIRTLQSIGVLGDTVAVLDPGNARLGLFSPDGDWLGHRQYMALSGSDIRLFATGPHEFYMPSIAMIGDQPELAYIRQTAAGPADTIAGRLREPGVRQAPPATGSLVVLCTHSAGRGISSYSAVLAPRTLVVPAPESLRAATWSAQYRIAFVNAAGDTVRVVERDIPSAPLSDEEWDDEQRRFKEFLDQFDDETCEPRTPPRPPVRRILLSIFFDDSGRTWVERETATGTVMDVFDGAGRLLAELHAPERLERVPPYIRDERLYLVVTDSLDIEYVKVYRISDGNRQES
jgi:hypothetical protein